MSLSDLASLGSLASGLAVLGSLVYLSIQTRQAAKHQRSLMMQGRAARRMELFYRGADPSFAPSYEKAAAGNLDALSGFELFQLFSQMGAQFASLQETWLEGQEGLQPKATQDATTRSLALFFSIPVFRAAWPMLRTTSDPEFVAVADRIMHETTSAPPGALTDALKRALAAELAKVRT